MNPKTLIYQDVEDKTKDLFKFIKRQSMIYDCTNKELLKYLIVLTRREVLKNDRSKL